MDITNRQQGIHQDQLPSTARTLTVMVEGVTKV
jgi:hypothetical protein